MFLDIGLGIFIALGVSHLSGVEPTSVIILAGILAALLPDIDVPIYLLFSLFNRQIDIGHIHRVYTHYPLLYIPLFVLVYMFAGPFWTVLVGLGVLVHFIHDTFFLGWGIQWLWPFSDLRVKCFPDRAGKIVWSKPVLTWHKHDEEIIKSQWRTEHWINTFYLHPTVISISEYGVLLASILALWII